MDKKIRANYKVFNDEVRPLFTREQTSNTILYNTFSTAQTNTALWTPAAGKRICLTAIEASSLAALVITLTRTGNAPFLSVVLTTTMSAFSESFPSPVIFAANERISLSTNASGTMYITLIGYEV
ncbi:hypothetical protein [Anaerospora sp.]|uniref:hypothetical protein n=1 Tax=Anaerospora sp. TaxID=1960278 RepID=UPI002896F554|nr:hypothetical protein [Anaerospora sp.]